MNILFYIEPNIQLNNPLLAANWAEIGVSNLARAFENAFEGDISIALTFNKEIEKYIPNDIPIVKISFEQIEAYEFGKYDYSAIENEILLNPNCNHACEKAKIIFEKLKGFYPDLIIAFSPCNFLRNVFSQTPIISYEYSAYSRNIHPENWFFDQNGPFHNSYLDKYLDEYIPQTEAVKAAINIAENTKKALRNTLELHNCCDLELNNKNKKFLLPLQFSNYPLFDAFTPILQQFKLAEYVAAKKPIDVTLIITEHPMSNEITKEARDYLQSQYQNVHFVKNKYPISTSDIISPIIDGYIGVTSKALFLSALWKKPLIKLAGNEVFASLASSNNINDDWSNLQPIDDIIRNKVLAYSFIEGVFLKSDLENKYWFLKTIKNCLCCNTSPKPLMAIRNMAQLQEIETNWIAHTNNRINYLSEHQEIFDFISIVNQDKKDECIKSLDIQISKNSKIENQYLKIEHSYHIAMSLLNHKGDFEQSAFYFDKAESECNSYLDKEHFGRIKGLYWHSIFHNIYSHYIGGRHDLAQQKYDAAIQINNKLFGNYDIELFSRLSAYCPQLILKTHSDDILS